MIKIIHLCEAFGLRLEIHGGGPGNLQILGAMGIPGEYYERGLLYPHFDYDNATPWLNQVIDPMDQQGNIRIPQRPGLGLDINWKFIEKNRVL